MCARKCQTLFDKCLNRVIAFTANGYIFFHFAATVKICQSLCLTAKFVCLFTANGYPHWNPHDIFIYSKLSLKKFFLGEVTINLNSVQLVLLENLSTHCYLWTLIPRMPNGSGLQLLSQNQKHTSRYHIKITSLRSFERMV